MGRWKIEGRRNVGESVTISCELIRKIVKNERERELKIGR